MCRGIPYKIDVGLIVKAIKELGARRVVLQLPDGLKQYSTTLKDCIEGLLEAEDVDLYIHVDSVFGACDLQYGQLYATIRPDLIIHVGHTPYPSELSFPGVEPRGDLGVRVVYVPALSLNPLPTEALKESARILDSYKASRVGVVTTSQHVHLVDEAVVLLEEMGVEAAKPRGVKPYFLDAQVIGCDYRVARSLKADAYLYIGGGVFHPLGLYLATLKPVVQVDPYTGMARDLTGEGEKLYRARLYRVLEAFEARSWGIIVGLKTGQYRPWLVSRLVEEITSRGGRYYLLASEILTLQHLVSIDSRDIDAFIVTSCPRIPTDDFWDYEKPVLTPGEAIMALRRQLEPYRFPW